MRRVRETSWQGRERQREVTAPDDARAADARLTPSTLEQRSTGLPASVRAPMERAFHHDFGSVRVVPNEPSVRERNGSALATAIDRTIAFAPGEYEPESDEGRYLIAHELAHVVQQSRRSDALGTPTSPSVDAAESDAHQAATSATRGEGATVEVASAVSPAFASEKDSIFGQLKERKEQAGGFSETLDMITSLFGPHKPEAGPNLQRADKGLSPLVNKSALFDGALESGSSGHVMENMKGTAGGGATWGGVGKTALGIFGGAAGDLAAGKDWSEAGHSLSQGLAKTVANPAVGDMMKRTGSGALSGFGGKVEALNNAAKFVGAPEELTGAVDAATSPLSASQTVISEGAGSWFNLLNSGASALAGDANWDKGLREQNEKGITQTSFLQPLYWAGEAASGGWDKLSSRLIGQEGRSGKMGSFVEAGNYWGDVMGGDRNLSKDLGDIGSFAWGGLNGDGGIKGAGKAAIDAGKTALDYWGGDGKKNFAHDAGEMWDATKTAASETFTAENALGAAEGITRFVGGDKLVGMTRDASDYWGKAFSGEGHIGQDVSDMASFAWGGADGKGGIKGSASSAWKKLKGIF